jgi:hypothetical protein
VRAAGDSINGRRWHGVSVSRPAGLQESESGRHARPTLGTTGAPFRKDHRSHHCWRISTWTGSCWDGRCSSWSEAKALCIAFISHMDRRPIRRWSPAFPSKRSAKNKSDGAPWSFSQHLSDPSLVPQAKARTCAPLVIPGSRVSRVRLATVTVPLQSSLARDGLSAHSHTPTRTQVRANCLTQAKR